MINLLVAASSSLIVALFGTSIAIRLLRARGVGQEIQAELPEGQQQKRGKPTMGGLVIVIAAAIGYLMAHFPLGLDLSMRAEGLLAMGTILALALLGFLDDYMKVSRRRSLGINKRAKFAGQLAVGLGFAAIAVHTIGVPTRLSFIVPSRISIGILFYLWVLLLITAWSNAMNFTDGMDGLAAGSAALVYGALVIVAFWKFSHSDIYQARYVLDLAIVAAAMMGACLGFLWWNAAPARIIMGDTGSLPLGGGLAALAILLDTQLLLVILGGLYVMETFSVSLQISTFHLFGGRRAFRMAPIHYHFELGGWPEVTVIVRFWIITGLFVALGLGVFYADFLARGGGV